MIDVKEAVQGALVFVREIMQDNRANSALLEEIELSEDRSQWLVTISVPAPIKPTFNAMIAGGGQVQERDFKLLRIDSDTGEVVSLTIRKV